MLYHKPRIVIKLLNWEGDNIYRCILGANTNHLPKLNIFSIVSPSTMSRSAMRIVVLSELQYLSCVELGTGGIVRVGSFHCKPRDTQAGGPRFFPPFTRFCLAGKTGDIERCVTLFRLCHFPLHPVS